MWFRVDDNLATHPKALAAGNRALGLWVRAGAWSGAHLTDGHVPAAIIAVLGGTKADAQRLVTAGLWTKASDGYQFHEWAERQPNSADVRAQREAMAERKRRSRLRAVE